MDIVIHDNGDEVRERQRYVVAVVVVVVLIRKVSADNLPTV